MTRKEFFMCIKEQIYNLKMFIDVFGEEGVEHCPEERFEKVLKFTEVEAKNFYKSVKSFVDEMREGTKDTGMWECEKSPDGGCHYFTDIDEEGNRYIVTRDKRKVVMDIETVREYESYDWCLFCGKPYERK